MGYLDQFARNQKPAEKTKVLPARLPISLYEQFSSRCDELNLSMSEAVRLLIEGELAGRTNTSVVASNTDVHKKYTKANQEETLVNTDVNKANTNVSSLNTSRFTVKKWELDGQLPCPICSSWVSSANFSRHAKQHEQSTKDIFTDPALVEVADKLLKERQ